MATSGAGLLAQQGSQRPPMAIPSSLHWVGPLDMSFEAKRSRRVAVAIPQVRVSGRIAVSPRQESLQPQQPDVAYHQTLIGWRSRQALDRGLGFGHVTVGPAVQQCLHQNTRRWNAPHQQLSLAEQMVDGGAPEGDGGHADPPPRPLP